MKIFPALRWRFRRRVFAAVVTLFAGALVARAQIGGAPSGPNPSSTYDTDVSTMIGTGCGYDAFSGAINREVVDFEVPGAISEHGLKWTRTTQGGTRWFFAYTWRYVGRPFGYMGCPNDQIMRTG